MKPFYIDINHKFHAWVIKHAKLDQYDFIDADICWYTRKVIRAMVNYAFKAALIGLGIFIACVITGMLGLKIANQIFHWFPVEWYWIPVFVLIGLSFVIVVLSVTVACVWFSLEVSPKAMSAIRHKIHDTPPTFVSQAYDSWKNKYCMKITIKKDDEA